MSSYLQIKPTEYGGRGYFSTRVIPKGTEILRCKGPFTGVIFKPFKKEVCAYCFSYDQGKNRKVKLESPGQTKASQPAYGGVHFCTPECRDLWKSEIDHDGLISKALNQIEMWHSSKRKPSQPIEMQQATSTSTTEDLWEKAMTSASDNRHLKKSQNTAPILESEEYDTARMVAVALVKKYRAVKGIREQSTMINEWNEFSELQSNETEFLTQFPAMCSSHIKVYKFLCASMPKILQPYISAELIRNCVGREAGNAFGLWQLPLHPESECMGSNLYSIASFFNHSCDPSVYKERIGREMVFTTTRDILPDEQLYISYGMLDNLGWEERVQQLNNQWHFICDCQRCRTEREGGEWAKL